ncbi:hemin-degrading factor [Rhodovulum sulfidophilum]|uniref:Hemin-degrading factor n=1 Tax=Rhodovulum visakhapatnamense TaxID=364297 RepID=A0ABS1RD49_9RHOB|nr:ChuX/HutX family heme-like substrate-binding protein [Rhodovulum visakhapatnamense]MBL3571147.1 hemin-degrading factor [Rhodovulum visakhapatnamense]MBL3577582.1 hemin-degrading factor [Rhodovulum visakhapatnamense]OLS46418.1 hemin-degrading factor [Rhodovulum sulfidophilum]
MGDGKAVSPDRIRSIRQEKSTARARDLADSLGVAEAELLAAETGRGVTRIAAHPDALMPAMPGLGEVMALTRNESAVIEKVGTYGPYTPGDHAAMVLSPAIDLRIFPRHWVHGFAVEETRGGKVRRSIQIFDGAGDAVHKIHLRDGSSAEAWQSLVDAVRLEDQSDRLTLDPRAPSEPAKVDRGAVETLRGQWDRLTDTHQFLQMVRKLKMNRLGAYRIAGAPYVRPLAPDCLHGLLNAVADEALPFMMFVGNRGCIEIHSGPIETVKPTGPWLNILDPGFNLHLRADHVAEVWAVTKPTRRGPALSVEAFDAEGMLILQAFGMRVGDVDHTGPWGEIVAALPGLEVAA